MSYGLWALQIPGLFSDQFIYIKMIQNWTEYWIGGKYRLPLEQIHTETIQTFTAGRPVSLISEQNYSNGIAYQ